MYIEGIFVENEYRKRGIATLLMDRLEEFAKSMGICQLASECNAVNYSSEALHLKNNFNICQKTIHFIKNIN